MFSHVPAPLLSPILKASGVYRKDLQQFSSVCGWVPLSTTWLSSALARLFCTAL
jgi:hypothetical protein